MCTSPRFEREYIPHPVQMCKLLRRLALAEQIHDQGRYGLSVDDAQLGKGLDASDPAPSRSTFTEDDVPHDGGAGDLPVAFESELRKAPEEHLSHQSLRPAASIQELGRRPVEEAEQIGIPERKSEAHAQLPSTLEGLLELHRHKSMVESSFISAR